MGRCARGTVSSAKRNGWPRGARASPVAGESQPVLVGRRVPHGNGTGGFDVIVGNPPYIRIQNMQTYSRKRPLFIRTSPRPTRQRGRTISTSMRCLSFDPCLLYGQMGGLASLSHTSS
ncbi:Eco57I restriction-modification methylase domain-containing protein [Thermomonas sp.]|uniref:Eco57I restriction-modification methylase domain-containing protein n=1 Tax=Thermomonas sp. TaxID=1971895 RepID=UPI002614F39D|nr:Eco57I restriction-modification methylase domain-containing protein [Thermomonas sp.]MCO5055454.1 Eco57I restriction-modification methylase domain-containing protein [Thermomonas sp.]